MKTLKVILVIILVIIAIPLIAALFISKDYTVEREVIINKPKEEVFDYVKYLKNQNEYSTWAKIDPDMKKEFRGEDGKVGFVSAWDSEKGEAGKGEQEIKKITGTERIDYEIRFIKPMESVSESYMELEENSAETTKVKWGFNGHMSYPFNFMQVFFDMEKLIGDDLQKGLEELKRIVENR